MNRVIRENVAFLTPFSILAILFTAVVLQTDQLELHLRTNRWHTPFADTIMPLITFLGDGIFVGIVVLLLSLYKLKSGLALLIASLVNSLSTQVLKREIFEHFRPAHYLEHHPDFLAIPGVDLAYQFSFPSGHTSAAFCLYFALALMFRTASAKVLMLLLAAAVGASRIYLNLHFLEDVVAGAVHGVFWAILIFGMAYSWWGGPSESSKYKWLEFSIFKNAK